MRLSDFLLLIAIVAFAVTASAAMILQFREDPPKGTGAVLLVSALFGMSTLTAYIAQT